MSKLIVTGGCPLRGRVRAGGRKNSALAVLPATLLADGPSVIENLPDIQDVLVYFDILRAMGVEVEARPAPVNGDEAPRGVIDPSRLSWMVPPQELVKRLRASYYLLGVLLAKYGRAEVPFPGGCDIGSRPIDQHIKGFTALGAKVTVEHGVIKAEAKRLIGAPVYLDVVTVGATVNIMLAATMAEGVTTIENAAKEPHIVDLANYLNAAGANVKGAGTDIIKIGGVKRLQGVTHCLIPDEIEAATYMIATAATGGDVVVEQVIPKHLESVSAKLEETGAMVEDNGDSIHVRGNGRPRPVTVKTLPYPGFPTDAQQQMTALLSVASGTSIISETIYEGRFKHVDELKRMGTQITVEGRTAIVQGVDHLTGAAVRATDLRAGAALIIAGLIARGETEISEIEHIDRGYERAVAKLSSVGAHLRRVP